MSYTIFFSHSSQDSEFVRAIQNQANPRGIAIYTYLDDLRPGENLSQKLIEQIKSCNAIVALLTNYSVNLPAIREEIGAARMAEKLVIPVIDSGIDMQEFIHLQGLEYIVLNRTNLEETKQRLIDHLLHLKNKTESDQKDQRIIFLLLFLGILFLMDK